METIGGPVRDSLCSWVQLHAQASHSMADCYDCCCSRATVYLGSCSEQRCLLLPSLCLQALCGPLPPLLGPLPLPLPLRSGAIALRPRGRHVTDKCASSGTLLWTQKWKVGIAIKAILLSLG